MRRVRRGWTTLTVVAVFMAGGVEPGEVAGQTGPGVGEAGVVGPGVETATLDGPPLQPLGRPPADQIPAVPEQVLQQLPPGCVGAWEAPSQGGGSTGSRETPAAAHATHASHPLDAAAVLAALARVPGAAPAAAAGSSDLLVPEEDSANNPSAAADPLSGLGPAPARRRGPGPSAAPGDARPGDSRPGDALSKPAAVDPHADLFLEEAYPSAQTCAKCHPQHYDEWAASAHAYASVSPMYQRFEQVMTELSQGTIGYFCVRCHAPVATELEIPREASLLDAPAVVREGITCVACHRVREAYSRTHGQRRIEVGSIFEPVYGGSDGAGVAAAVADRQRLKLKTSPHDPGPGQEIHRAAIHFEQISRSDFCYSCHQVAVHPGIWLEVVYAQYRASPAHAKGITCQDCHMGAVPGKPEGYEEAHIATVAEQPYGAKRKKSNHNFWGPGYSIAHPGIFPHNPRADRWGPRQWLAFDYRSGWGTEAFENRLPAAADHIFPPPWQEADERRDARRVIDANLRRLAVSRADSITTMENASEIAGPFFDRPARRGQPLQFHYTIHNRSEGHNLPTGSLGAQPQVWLNVSLIDPRGVRVWESGYLDSRGDLADLHSTDVARGRLPRDAQLFNLQTKFLVTNLKGTDREVAVPINIDLDPIPFLRPGAVPVTVLNHPPLIRMEARSLPPLGQRKAPYQIPAAALQHPGTYRLNVRLRSRPEPSYFMQFVGATPEMIQRMNEQILNLHPQSFSFDVP